MYIRKLLEEKFIVLNYFPILSQEIAAL